MTASIPAHVGIILDGNRRWAKARGLDPWEGHKVGIATLDRAIGHAIERGISALTVYGFSTENWKRSSAEVAFLMQFFEATLRDRSTIWQEQGVRFRHLGQLDRLPASLRECVVASEAASAENSTLTFGLCLSYGGRDEVVRAVQQLFRTGMTPDAFTEEVLTNALDSAGLPDPDLIIRTSGEQRLSGFLMWQSVYSELYFTPTPWPDFDEAAFDTALAWYAERQRRYGA